MRRFERASQIFFVAAMIIMSVAAFYFADNILLESTVLGAIQGITEWLPISSEGVIVLLKSSVFGGGGGLVDLIKTALFLHLGTFLAALVYFRKDVAALLKGLLSYNSSDMETRNTLKFLIIATLVSGAVGYMVLQAIVGLEGYINPTSSGIIIVVGVLLLATGVLEMRHNRGGIKRPEDLKAHDGILLGLVQGLSILPGLSRSGLTVAALLLRKMDKTHALRLSFLMSLPIVLGANIALNMASVEFTTYSFVSLAFSFLFGMLTINLLMGLSRKINFGYFVLVFAALTFASAAFV